MARSIELAAPVKVNLHLGIYSQLDERGYHRADSVMVAIGVGDRVVVRELSAAAAAEGPRIAMSEDVGVDPQHNTVWKAAVALCRAFGEVPAYQIEVQKAVVPQSGLGGSSSDAASVILALCELWGVDASDARVVEAARSVGADVPFFLHPAPSYLGGAGDVLEKSFPDLSGVPVVLVRPNEGVSTVAAYREFDRLPSAPADPAGMFEALEVGDASLVAARLANNLEPVAMRLVGACAQAKRWLLGQPGVMGVQVSGSGSCLFALCESEADAARIAASARDEQNWWSASCFTVGMGAQFC